jgi:hypothetical protein
MNLDLEKIRLIHEDIGRLEVTAAKVMTPIPKSVIFHSIKVFTDKYSKKIKHRETLYQQHIVNSLRGKIIDKKRKLNEIYGDYNNR